MTTDQPLSLDSNGRSIGAGLCFDCTKTRTYTGASGLGATGATTLFTVTGQVIVKVVGFCTVDITGAGTLEVGISGNTAGLLAQIADATNLDAGESYIDATPATLEAVDLSSGFLISNGQDIIETIGSTALTGGTCIFACFWRPITSGSSVVPA